MNVDDFMKLDYRKMYDINGHELKSGDFVKILVDYNYHNNSRLKKGNVVRVDWGRLMPMGKDKMKWMIIYVKSKSGKVCYQNGFINGDLLKVNYDEKKRKVLY